MMGLREDVAALFEDAQSTSEIALRYNDALVTNLRVIGGSRMPWGDEANFAAWCDRQVPAVRRAFAKRIAERAERDERGPGVASARAARPPMPPAGLTHEPVPYALLTLIARTATLHQVAIHGVLSPSRSPSLVRARDHAMALIRWSTGLSFPEIGRLFDRDHTSVIAAVDRYEVLLNEGTGPGRVHGW
jgi:hypothetical protein